MVRLADIVSVGASEIYRITRSLFFEMRRLIGEAPWTKRTTLHRIVILCLLTAFFLPFAVYIIQTNIVGTDLPAQFNIFAITPIMGGLALTAAAGFKDKPELLGVAQKFISATVFFIVFIPSIYVVDTLPAMNPYTWELSKVAVVRGLFFGLPLLVFSLASPCSCLD